jgi:hypothetical protein
VHCLRKALELPGYTAPFVSTMNCTTHATFQSEQD